MIRQDWSTLKKLMFAKTAAGGAAAVEATATGNPLIFLTDLARPLKSLLIPFTPQQTGSGDPSPSNIRPIVPWDWLSVWNSGKNLAKLTYGTKIPSINTGQMVTSNGWSSDFIRIDKTKNYYCSGTASLGNVYALYYGADYSYLGNRSHNTSGFSLNSDSYFSSATYVKLRNDSNSSKVLNIQLEEGQTATAYEEAHITETDISFPSPVYGGKHEAVSGRLTDGWKTETFDGSSDELWNFTQVGTSAFYRAYIRIYDIAQDNDVAILADKYKAVSFDNRSFSQKVCMATNKNESPQYVSFITDETTVEAFKAWLAENPVTIAYMTSAPQEIQLTPAQITALVGNNTIWSDADGSMTAIYLKKG